jgi:hypothetical protein
MKRLTIVLTTAAVLCSVNFLVAQQTETVNKEKMKVFSFWVGRWQGEGWMQMGPGEPKKSSVDEKVESKLDGTVMLVEGIGKATGASGQEMIVHHAMGVLSYDQASGQYKFRSYLKDGRSTEAWFTVAGENRFEWGFDIPNRGKTRYSITLDPAKKTWNEIGQFSADGTAWSKFFEMNLKKTE